MADVDQNRLVTFNEYITAKQYFFEGESNKCWPWHGSFYSGGHPYISVNGIQYAAHRVTLLYSLGLKSSPLLSLHKPECKNKPNCVNPAHLYLGTYKQNTHDCLKEGNHRSLHQNGSKNNSSNLTDEIVLKIRFEYDAFGFTQRYLAKKYNTTQQNISMIIQRKTWTHI